ncbi:fluoride export protein 1-like isoform X1 [Tasmannia lanceolata]|uniref:fluoride export protein 1-like isoform X1 n=2 Tax=Tasmannia lanceolata TaxID=3420 RepID=UPI004062E307
MGANLSLPFFNWKRLLKRSSVLFIHRRLYQKMEPINGYVHEGSETVQRDIRNPEFVTQSESFSHLSYQKDVEMGSSFGRRKNAGSWRKNSTSFSQVLDDISVAQSGDSGDRSFRGEGCSRSSSLRFGPDELLSVEDGARELPEDAQSLSQSSKDNQKSFPPSLKYISCLIHLAVFGIMGVFARYLLQKLFGPSVAGTTSDQTPLYLDLPSNMVGSFLMGWLGIVFKADINEVSDLLAIGLTTGFLGSLTTFSGWNQKMLDLSAEGHWVNSMVGLLIGMLLVVMLIKVGVDTATGFRYLLNRRGMLNSSTWKVDSYKGQLILFSVFVLMLGLLWFISVASARIHLERDHISAELWLACIVGPPGVWLRFVLARLNGRGLGRNGLMKWFPFGTLAANVFAACLMAALATIRNVVATKRCDIIVTGIQLGFLGCLSTVSTFVAEVYTMGTSDHPRRAYFYSMVTIILSFALGTLIYSVPVWTKGYQ